MTRLRQYALPLLLATCAVLTAGLLLWPVTAASPTAVVTAPRYAGPEFAQRPAGRLNAFPLTLGVVETAAPPPAVETPVLVGVAGSTAYLRSRSSGLTVRVAMGDELDGWTLIGAGTRTVTLRGPAGDRRLDLFPARTDPPPPASPAQGDPDLGGP